MEFGDLMNISLHENLSFVEADDSQSEYMTIVYFTVAILLGIIALLGLVGNLSVMIVVAVDQKMRCSSNILIAGLALADLCDNFCLPFLVYMNATHADGSWPFGDLACKVSQLSQYVNRGRFLFVNPLTPTVASERQSARTADVKNYK